MTSSFISVVKGWANNENRPPLLCAWALTQKPECSLSKGVVCALGAGTRVKQVRHQGYNHQGHGPKRQCLTCLVLFGALVCSRMTSAQRVSESGRTHQKISPSFDHAPWENMINSYPCHCPKNPSYVFVRFILCMIVCYLKACIYVSRLSFSFLLLNFGVQVYDFSNAFLNVLVSPQRVASSIFSLLFTCYRTFSGLAGSFRPGLGSVFG